MKNTHLMAIGVALAALVAAAPAVAQKKTLAVVVKGLDNPFFTVLGDGCALWNKENPKSEYTCLYTGPASSADALGEGGPKGRVRERPPRPTPCAATQPGNLSMAWRRWRKCSA